MCLKMNGQRGLPWYVIFHQVRDVLWIVELKTWVLWMAFWWIFCAVKEFSELKKSLFGSQVEGLIWGPLVLSNLSQLCCVDLDIFLFYLWLLFLPESWMSSLIIVFAQSMNVCANEQKSYGFRQNFTQIVNWPISPFQHPKTP